MKGLQFRNRLYSPLSLNMEVNWNGLFRALSQQWLSKTEKTFFRNNWLLMYILRVLKWVSLRGDKFCGLSSYFSYHREAESENGLEGSWRFWVTSVMKDNLMVWWSIPACFTAVNNDVFPDLTSCGLTEVNRNFGEMCCLQWKGHSSDLSP